MAGTAARVANLTPQRRKLLEKLLQAKRTPAGAADPAVLSFSAGSSEGESKTQFRQFYDGVNRQLAASGFGELSFFLNYGYAANGSAESAVIVVPAQVPNRNSVKLVLELIGACQIEGRDVLDVGCGRGGTIYVMQRFFRPRTTTGLDLSREALEFCRRTHRYDGCRFLQGDAESLPFRNGSFDVVTNVESSHSYPDVAAFYAEVYRVLRRGGWFLYADSMPAGERKARMAALRETGFEIRRDTDITANVLLSCDQTARRRREAFAGQEEILNDFLAIPGSTIYEQMHSGFLSYRIWTLRK